MRPVVQKNLNGVGTKPWVMLNYLQNNPNIGLYGVISSGASITYTVQYSPAGENDAVPVLSLTRAAGVATAIIPNHGLTTGDSIVISGAGAPFDTPGSDITFVDANTFTYAVANSGPTNANGTVMAIPMPVFTVTGMSAQTTRVAGSLTNPAGAVRVNITINASGGMDFYVLQGMGR